MKTLKVNDKITGNVMGQEITGIITGFGMHKGRNVIDIQLSDYSGRFIYESQIIK